MQIQAIHANVKPGDAGATVAVRAGCSCWMVSKWTKGLDRRSMRPPFCKSVAEKTWSMCVLVTIRTGGGPCEAPVVRRNGKYDTVRITKNKQTNTQTHRASARIFCVVDLLPSRRKCSARCRVQQRYSDRWCALPRRALSPLDTRAL